MRRVTTSWDGSMLTRLFRLLITLLILAAVPGVFMLALEQQREVSKARSEYYRAMADLQSTTKQLERVETQLRLLTTEVSAVQDEARRQFRLVKPGEQLIMIGYQAPTYAAP